MEAYLEIRQRAYRIATITEPPVQNAKASEPLVACYNALNEQIIQLRTLSFAVPALHDDEAGVLVDRLREIDYNSWTQGKQNQPSANTACDDSLVSRRIFVTDRKSKTFLIDTGADICVYRGNKLRESANKDTYELFAANGWRIATYGTILVSLDIALRRALKWRFIIVNINTSIIDFP